MQKLNHIEKIVLASIQHGNTTIQLIYEDTLLPLYLIQNTLTKLDQNQLIKKSSQNYFPLIHSSHSQLWKIDKYEAFSFIEKAYQTPNSFQFKLARFRKDDFKEYQHLTHRLHEFIKDCNQRNHIPSKEQRYLFWGQVSQSQIIHQYQ